MHLSGTVFSVRTSKMAAMRSSFTLDASSTTISSRAVYRPCVNWMCSASTLKDTVLPWFSSRDFCQWLFGHSHGRLQPFSSVFSMRQHIIASHFRPWSWYHLPPASLLAWKKIPRRPLLSSFPLWNNPLRQPFQVYPHRLLGVPPLPMWQSHSGHSPFSREPRLLWKVQWPGGYLGEGAWGGSLVFRGSVQQQGWEQSQAAEPHEVWRAWWISEPNEWPIRKLSNG